MSGLFAFTEHHSYEVAMKKIGAKWSNLNKATFGGIRYYADFVFSSKLQAGKWARKHIERGYKVKITRTSHGYQVWTKPISKLDPRM